MDNSKMSPQNQDTDLQRLLDTLEEDIPHSIPMTSTTLGLVEKRMQDKKRAQKMTRTVLSVLLLLFIFTLTGLALSVSNIVMPVLLNSAAMMAPVVLLILFAFKMDKKLLSKLPEMDRHKA